MHGVPRVLVLVSGMREGHLFGAAAFEHVRKTLAIGRAVVTTPPQNSQRVVLAAQEVQPQFIRDCRLRCFASPCWLACSSLDRAALVAGERAMESMRCYSLLCCLSAAEAAAQAVETEHRQVPTH